MKKLLAVVFSLLILPLSFAAPEKKSFVIEQKNAPIQLAKPGFRIEENRTVESVLANSEYTNKSNKAISALSLGFIFYGPFNNQLDGRGGLDLRDSSSGNLEPGKADTGQWDFNFSGDFSTTTMIVFVNRVRFADGTIWQADTKELDIAIRALTGSEFDPLSIK
jgi:hypothetical protein